MCIEAPGSPMLQALFTHVNSHSFLHSSLEPRWSEMNTIDFILQRERERGAWIRKQGARQAPTLLYNQGLNQKQGPSGQDALG